MKLELAFKRFEERERQEQAPAENAVALTPPSPPSLRRGLSQEFYDLSPSAIRGLLRSTLETSPSAFRYIFPVGELRVH